MIDTTQVASWLAASLRCTIFAHLPPNSVESLSLQWVTQEPPDQVTTNPKANIREEISYSNSVTRDSVLILKHEPGRIDLLRQAKFPDDAPPLDQVPNLGPFKDQCIEFSTNALRLCEYLEANRLPALRVAFGADCICPVADREAGYRMLNEYLPFVEVDPLSSDFNYGINRRRHSKATPPLQINRLSHWSTKKLTTILPQTGITNSSYLASLMLDINSVPDSSIELSGSQCEKLYRELVELAVEITEQGDCK